jgi:group I intron endonuclease
MRAAIQSNAGIYQVRNLANGKVYVGSALNMRHRWTEHLSKLKRGCHHSSKLQNAFNKYGKESFVFEVLCDVADLNSLLSLEQHYIDLLNASSSGYNICPVAGRTAGRKASDETRRKMRDSQLRVPVEIRRGRAEVVSSLQKTDEWKAKIGRANLGKVHSDDVRKKLSDSAKSRSDEANFRIAEGIRKSDIARGGRHSNESKAKISNSLKGRKLSDQHRLAIKQAWAKRKAAATSIQIQGD